MPLYLLVDITVQGPSGDHELRFSNLSYVVRSGADEGVSYRASITKSASDGFRVERKGYRRREDKVLVASGLLGRKVSEIVVANPYDPYTGERELDYLFSDDYTLEGNVVIKQAWSEVGQPDVGDFTTLLTGTLLKRPTKSQGRVSFPVQSRHADADAPLLTERFTGMAGGLLSAPGFLIESDAGVYPNVLGGDFTVQFRIAPFVGVTETVLQWIDGGGTPLVRLYVNGPDQSLYLDVYNGVSADSYKLYSVAAYTRTRPFFGTLVWKTTTFDAYLNDDKLVSDTAVLSLPIGMPSKFNRPSSNTFMFSISYRVWGRELSATEIKDRNRAIEDHTSEVSLALAWEFDERRGIVATDYSGNNIHATLTNDTLWFSLPIDGEADDAETIIPLVLGNAFGVPVKIYDDRIRRGMVSATALDIIHVYSQGIALVRNIFEGVASRYMDHNRDIMYSLVAEDFGYLLTPRQNVSISGGTGTWSGTFILDSLTPNNLRRVRPRGDDYRFTLRFESTDWTTSGADNVNVSHVLGEEDFLVTALESPYDALANANLPAIYYNDDFPEPTYADVVGDGEIMDPFITPTNYDPPGTLDNVVTQVVRKYGPGWDTATFPTPSYGSLPFRVGYYVDDQKPTSAVLNDLLNGCLVWLIEGGNGQFLFTEFKFPDELAPLQNIIDADSVVSVTEESVGSNSLFKIPALTTMYKRNWTTLDAGNIAQGVNSDTAAFNTKQWREILIGTPPTAGGDIPEWQTYENRKTEARTLGERALRLSRGKVYTASIRVHPSEQPSAFQIGSRVDGDLSRLGAGNYPKIVVESTMRPTVGLMTVSFWQEN
jgi:hypothetical protein